LTRCRTGWSRACPGESGELRLAGCRRLLQGTRGCPASSPVTTGALAGIRPMPRACSCEGSAKAGDLHRPLSPEILAWRE
jgi:hypothetical protein